MIYGLIHPGSGVGNQLHRYVATRVLARDKGYAFSMVNPEAFKGASFMDLDFGENGVTDFHIEMPAGKVVVDTNTPLWEESSKNFNPEFFFIEDGTVIDGEFQDLRYFGHRLKHINKWLAVEPIDIPDDTCVIGFRGGEFYVFPELGLPKKYYDQAIAIMKSKGIEKFEVHTDDEGLARQFFPDYKIIHDVGINWRSVRFAKHAIIANSSFYILPRLLKHRDDKKALTVAPHYWARYNTKEWSMPQNYYPMFKYI